ncbi:MAG: NTP transferase domain-containing protein, partial [Acidimicrobiales bacterium]
MSTLAAVLAAGDGSRFGGPKLLVYFRGRPLVAWALDAALDAGLDETVVVVGSQALGAVVPDGITVLDNPR